MSIERTVRVEREIAVPAAEVWARVSDHEGTPSWITQVASVKLTEPGPKERGGLGAVRRVAFKPLLWTTVLERIVEYRSPERFHYVVVAGMPGLLAHEGRVIVEPRGANASTLRWEVDFTFRSFHWMRPFVPSFITDFQGVLAGGLAELARQLESR